MYTFTVQYRKNTAIENIQAVKYQYLAKNQPPFRNLLKSAHSMQLSSHNTSSHIASARHQPQPGTTSEGKEREIHVAVCCWLLSIFHM